MGLVLGSRSCVICGQEHPTGMRLRFAVDEEGSESGWTVQERFAGFHGVLHGGLVLAVMDDAMWYAIYAQGGVSLTAEATVRYRRRVEVGQAIAIRGRVQEHRGRLWTCTAEVVSAGTAEVLAAAEGKFVTVRAEDYPALVGETRVHELPAEG